MASSCQQRRSNRSLLCQTGPRRSQATGRPGSRREAAGRRDAAGREAAGRRDAAGKYLRVVGAAFRKSKTSL
eukprot:4447190-Prymnesium_polylepis.2